MAKRVADVQLTKDNPMSEEDGFSVGSQLGGPQRATAAQMAARKLAKPRGGRRPGAAGQVRHAQQHTTGFTQTQQSPFQLNNTNTMNGTSQQQGVFGSSNGNPPNQISQSFPPFGNSNNTGFNTQFTAPSSTGFNFTGGQALSNNPFITAPDPIEPLGKNPFHSIRRTDGDEKPLFAAHSPFHNNIANTPPSDQSQIVQNPFGMSASQQQAPNTVSSSLFSQPPGQQQQQTSSNISAPAQPAKTTAGLFAHLKQLETQTPSPFSQSSLFQQPGTTQNTSNIFEHLTPSQPSATVEQSKATIAGGDQTMMSTSPDTSPFGSSNGGRTQLQISPTKDVTSAGTGGSVFDRISKPTSGTTAETPVDQSQDPSPAIGVNSIFAPLSKSSEESPLQPHSLHATNSPFNFSQPSKSSTLLQTPSGETQQPKKKLFGNSLPPQSESFQPPAAPAASLFLPVDTPDALSSDNAPAVPNATSTFQVESSSGTSNNVPSRKRKYSTIQDAPDNFTEEEKIQLVTGYRLKALDMGIRKRLRTNPPEPELEALKAFYDERVNTIIAARGGALAGQAPGSKRKADGDKEEVENVAKKPKSNVTSPTSRTPLPNGTGPAGSQTSSLFRNILGGATQPAANGTSGNKSTFATSTFSQTQAKSSPEKVSPKTPLFVPKVPSIPSLPSQTRSTSESPFTACAPHNQAAAASKVPNLFSGLNTANSTSSTITATSQEVNPSLPVAKVPSTSVSSNHISTKPSTNDHDGSQTQQAPAFKVPAFGAFPSANNLDGAKTQQAPAFTVPAFGAGASTNFIAQFGDAAQKEANKEKEKRKLEDLDSDDDEEAWECKYQEEERAKKQKLEAETKGKFLKLINGKMQWTEPENADSSNPEIPKGNTLEPPLSVFGQPHAPLTNGHNIFGHLSGEESGAEGSKTGDADDEDDENDDEEEEIQTTMNGAQSGKTTQANSQKYLNSPFATQSTQSAIPPPSAATTSLFDRISKDAKGNPVREIPKPDSKLPTSTTSIFGQSTSTFGSPSKPLSFGTSNLFSQAAAAKSTTGNVDGPSPPIQGLFDKANPSIASKNVFGKASSSTPADDAAETGKSPKGDRTWNPESPIKFGSSSDAPAVNITAPSPSKSPFSGLFGAPKTNSTDSPAKPVFNPFSATPTKPPATGLGFGFTPANPVTKSLVPPSNSISTSTSRATSPGVTTGESANESTADKDDDDISKDEQVDLTSGGPGEEDEDVLFTVKAKALNYNSENKTWITKGLGPLRVMKHRETGITRLLMRQEPSGKIVLNYGLLKGLKYEKASDKAIRVPIVNDTGKIENLMLRVGKDEDAQNMVSIISENQPK